MTVKEIKFSDWLALSALVVSIVSIVYSYQANKSTDFYSYENAKPVIEFSNISVDIIKYKGEDKVVFKADLENMGVLTAKGVQLSYEVFTGTDKQSLFSHREYLSLGDLYKAKTLNLAETRSISCEKPLPEITSKSIVFKLTYDVDSDHKNLVYSETYVYNPISNKFEVKYARPDLFSDTVPTTSVYKVGMEDQLKDPQYMPAYSD